MKISLLIIGLLIMNACVSKPATPINLDHLNYLENVESTQAFTFVDTENTKTLDRLTSQPQFKKIENDLYQILSAKDKIAEVFVHNNHVYNFWQDDRHTRGQLRRMPIQAYKNLKTEWELVLDVDALAEKEKKNWAWKGFHCLSSNDTKCLIFLSDGGKDAHTAREFNLKDKQFVANGFFIPESKSYFTWIDENRLLWSDGLGNLSSSGYPLQLKILTRGQEVSKAVLVDEAAAQFLSISTSLIEDRGKKHLTLHYQVNFYSAEYFLVPDLNNLSSKIKIPIPADAVFLDIFDNNVIFNIKTDFKIKSQIAPAGSVITFPLEQIKSNEINYEIIFKPSPQKIFENYTSSKNKIWISALSDVRSKIFEISHQDNSWPVQELSHSLHDHDFGSWEIQSAKSDSSTVILNYSDFLTPRRFYILDDQTIEGRILSKVAQAPEHFDSSQFTVEQFKVPSQNDGTLIPYFVIRNKNISFHSKNPTILYGYGGFEISNTPSYRANTGKAWLENGGVFVLANIRGGGEYGPAWHKAALRENRQKAFDDFYSIAQDIIDKKITSPAHLGAWGGSNGGLLTSVALTQRPQLFKAIISEVPLANMMRYHKLLAGASWIAEYGDPDSPVDREFILKYSPLHNLKKNVHYPEAFYLTSTKDDRVHPAHARQMAARLRELGHTVLYYENKDGGHGRAVNPKDMAQMLALEYTYLLMKLR